MSLTRHTCRGCGADLACQRDLEKVPGTATRAWRCAYCGTTVPAVVGEKIQHQRHHETR